MDPYCTPCETPLFFFPSKIGSSLITLFGSLCIFRFGICIYLHTVKLISMQKHFMTPMLVKIRLG